MDTTHPAEPRTPWRTVLHRNQALTGPDCEACGGTGALEQDACRAGRWFSVPVRCEACDGLGIVCPSIETRLADPMTGEIGRVARADEIKTFEQVGAVDADGRTWYGLAHREAA